MSAPQPPNLLTIPCEIRDHIIGELFFPGEKQPLDFSQDRLGLAPTARRQIWPYDTDDHKKPRFDTAIIRTCRQLQQEAEEILCGTSSWNLMYQDWDDPLNQSYEFFEKLPKRLRRLVRRVERKCYSEPYMMTISLFDWNAFMTFLARECPNLHSLKLWGPGDPYEGPAWVQTCREDKEWVQAILQIKSLRYFDIPVIAGGVIYDYPEFRDIFLPWLKGELMRPSAVAVHGGHPGDLDGAGSYASARQRSSPVTQPIDGPLLEIEKRPFRFLDLPRAIRDRIYQSALLPQDGRIHPTIRPWYDNATLTLLPLLLTNKQIHFEARTLFYSSATFTAPLAKHMQGLHHFLVSSIHPPFHITRVRLAVDLLPSLSFSTLTDVREDLLSLLATRFCIRRLEYCFHHPRYVRHMNRTWPSLPEGLTPHAMGARRYRHAIGKWPEFMRQRELLALARIPDVVVETPEGCELDPGPREWLTSGLRKAWLGESRPLHESLEWLREDRIAYLRQAEGSEPVDYRDS